MDDPRFTTSCATLEDLLDLVQLDTIDELETFLMFLFRRPVRVRYLQAAEDDEGALEVIIPGDDCNIGHKREFPFDLGELVLSAIQDLEDTGPYTSDGEDVSSSRDLASLTEVELEAAMVDAFGETRIFVLLDSTGE